MERSVHRDTVAYCLDNGKGEPMKTSARLSQKLNAIADGTDTPRAALRLRHEVPGILRAVHVEEGQKIKAGELIAELENSDTTARRDSVLADLAVSEAQLKIVNGNLAAEIVRAQCEVARLKADAALMEAGPRKEEIGRAQAERRVADAEARRGAEDAARFADPAGVKAERGRKPIEAACSGLRKLPKAVSMPQRQAKPHWKAAAAPRKKIARARRWPWRTLN